MQSVLRLPSLMGGAVFGLSVWLFGAALRLPRPGLAPAMTALPTRMLAILAAAHVYCINERTRFDG
ncbi:MAG: hypothetical protein HYY04_10505 [Chloroflexi bacterium]|nr:hypothetical protein [Chloroflexota bacterium]